MSSKVPGIRRREGKRGVTYQVEIRLKGHRPATKTFKKLSDAKRWKSQTETKLREQRYFGLLEGSRMTLSEAIARYTRLLNPKSGRVSQLTWWKGRLGDMTLAEVSPAVIAESRDELARSRARGEGGRSNATVNRYLAALSHLFTVAVKEWQWLEQSPMPRVRRLRESRGRVRYLDEAERESFLDACRSSQEPLFYPLVILALSTGARAGELLALTWRDIDLEKGVGIVHRSKNGDRRRLAIRGLALEELRRLSRVRRIDTDRLFPNEVGTGSWDYRYALKAALKDSEIENFRFHDLRHCAASYMAMNGATPGELAEVLGHRTLQMVKRYAHLSDAHVAGVVESMNDRFLSAQTEAG